MVRERERENVLQPYVQKSALERRRTRINILVKAANVVAHQKFSKAFHFSWYAFCTWFLRSYSSHCKITSLEQISELVYIQAVCPF